MSLLNVTVISVNAGSTSIDPLGGTVFTTDGAMDLTETSFTVCATAISPNKASMEIMSLVLFFICPIRFILFLSFKHQEIWKGRLILAVPEAVKLALIQPQRVGLSSLQFHWQHTGTLVDVMNLSVV